MTGAFNAGSQIPCFPIQLSKLANGVSAGATVQHPGLQAQVQPFQAYTPQQIQEQLQQLHIKQQNESEVVHQQTQAVGADAVLHQQQQTQFQIMPMSSGDEREISPAIESSNNPCLHHLLSTTKSTTPSTLQANSFDKFQPSRPSYTDSVRKTQHLSTNLGHHGIVPSKYYSIVSSQYPQELPTFPVHIRTPECSPTNNIGRCSPNHDMQALSITEITTVSRGPHGVHSNTEDVQMRSVTAGVQSKAMHIPNEHHSQPQMLCSHGSNGVQSLAIDQPNRFFSQQPDSQLSMPIMAPSFSIYPNILTRISAILSNNGIQHSHSNGGLVVEHNGVKLQIICNLPHLNTIQMQYIAGDTMQYQTLSSQLATQLQFVE